MLSHQQQHCRPHNRSHFNWNSWTEPGGDWGTNATDNMFARGCATEQLSSCQNELVGDSVYS